MESIVFEVCCISWNNASYRVLWNKGFNPLESFPTFKRATDTKYISQQWNLAFGSQTKKKKNVSRPTNWQCFKLLITGSLYIGSLIFLEFALECIKLFFLLS